MPAPARATRLNLPEGFSLAGALEAEDFPPSRRADGWTAERQRTFLATLAEGTTVEAAAAAVGLSPQSAYALRQRAAGAAFAVGWHAALLLQRQKLTDALTSRAFDGQVDTLTRADGSVVLRHRHDNRLGLALLTRLDRLAAADGDADRMGEAAAARTIAGEWQRYLDLVAADATPAEAGLFLAARTPAAPIAANDVEPVDALAPVLTLARADLYCRTGAGTAGEVDTADLNPARRAAWTAEQWIRAEAAGLVALAPDPQLPQHSPAATDADAWDEEPFADEPVWYDDDREEWRTSFPCPADYYPDEYGHYGESDYHRALSPAEEAIVGPAPGPEPVDPEAIAARDRWFADRAAATARVPTHDGSRPDDQVRDDIWNDIRDRSHATPASAAPSVGETPATDPLPLHSGANGSI